MKSYTVYLFRHGLTKGNLNAQYIGQTDLPLTMDSINQLHTLRGKYPYPEVDAVFTSPLKRCKDSAAILFPRNNLITIEDFKEYNFGEFEGKTAAELQDNLDFRDWLQGVPRRGDDDPAHLLRPAGGSHGQLANGPGLWLQATPGPGAVDARQ